MDHPADNSIGLLLQQRTHKVAGAMNGSSDDLKIYYYFYQVQSEANLHSWDKPI